MAAKGRAAEQQRRRPNSFASSILLRRKGQHRVMQLVARNAHLCGNNKNPRYLRLLLFFCGGESLRTAAAGAGTTGCCCCCGDCRVCDLLRRIRPSLEAITSRAAAAACSTLLMRLALFRDPSSSVASSQESCRSRLARRPSAPCGVRGTASALSPLRPAGCRPSAAGEPAPLSPRPVSAACWRRRPPRSPTAWAVPPSDPAARRSSRASSAAAEQHGGQTQSPSGTALSPTQYVW